MTIKTKITAALIAALAIVATAGNAVAQSGYPDHAVKMVVGYPPAAAADIPALKLDEGLVGAAVTSQMPLLVNDVGSDTRYVAMVPGMASELVVPAVPAFGYRHRRPTRPWKLKDQASEPASTGR